MKSITTIVFWIGSCASLVTFRGVAGVQSEPGGTLAPTVIKESLFIAESELPELITRAEAKETDAALRLASYYGMYLGDTKKQLHYCEIAAGNGSEKALHNLMMIFASRSESFDFERALQMRTRLKVAVAARNGKMETDGEWAYDMYVEHFIGYGNKRRGMLFLEYAANHGSDKAATELARVLSEDPSLAKFRKGKK